jgi:hypothetical protein
MANLFAAVSGALAILLMEFSNLCTQRAHFRCHVRGPYGSVRQVQYNGSILAEFTLSGSQLLLQLCASAFKLFSRLCLSTTDLCLQRLELSQ